MEKKGLSRRRLLIGAVGAVLGGKIAEHMFSEPAPERVIRRNLRFLFTGTSPNLRTYLPAIEGILEAQKKLGLVHPSFTITNGRTPSGYKNSTHLQITDPSLAEKIAEMKKAHPTEIEVDDFPAFSVQIPQEMSNTFKHFQIDVGSNPQLTADVVYNLKKSSETTTRKISFYGELANKNKITIRVAIDLQQKNASLFIPDSLRNAENIEVSTQDENNTVLVVERNDNPIATKDPERMKLIHFVLAEIEKHLHSDGVTQPDAISASHRPRR